MACRRPVRAEEEAEHRSWEPGDGHVGLAFQTRRPIVASDTSDPEASHLFDASPPKRRDDDRERYRSIASIPIRLQDETPVGVVVATSDIANRFTLRRNDDNSARDAVEPLRSLASALAMLIRTTHIGAGRDSK
jgi:GAF domain-containing protein